MTRLTPLHRDQLDDERAAVWDGLIESRGGDVSLQAPDGSLVGPFNAFVHAPKIGKRLLSLGGLVRFRTTIERRLSEVAICTVGAHWQSEFEFYAHAPMAIEHGVDPSIIDAMRAGETPAFEQDDERLVYEIANQLLTDHRVDPATYAAGEALFGEQGLVELVTTIGYYCLISITLNLFEVGLPDGVDPNWPELT